MHPIDGPPSSCRVVEIWIIEHGREPSLAASAIIGKWPVVAEVATSQISAKYIAGTWHCLCAFCKGNSGKVDW